MGWVREGGFASHFELRPQLYADYRAFADAVSSALEPRLVELCRARVDYLLGASATSIEPVTDCERACLALADKFVLDPHGVTDGDAGAVAAHLTSAAMVALVEALALFDGFARFRLILGVKD